MILCCYELFSQRSDILKCLAEESLSTFWWMSFRISTVLQYKILQMLAAPANNLFIVGDDDQSIYHFRGARPEIMLNFTKGLSGGGDSPSGCELQMQSSNILHTAMECDQL